MLTTPKLIKRIKRTHPNRIIVGSSKKNLEFMENYGYSTEDIIKVIKSLTVEDYYEGPEMINNDPKHDCFMFHKQLDVVYVYIKLYIYKKNIFVKSFHKNEEDKELYGKGIL